MPRSNSSRSSSSSSSSSRGSNGSNDSAKKREREDKRQRRQEKRENRRIEKNEKRISEERKKKNEKEDSEKEKHRGSSLGFGEYPANPTSAQMENWEVFGSYEAPTGIRGDMRNDSTNYDGSGSSHSKEGGLSGAFGYQGSGGNGHGELQAQLQMSKANNQAAMRGPFINSHKSHPVSEFAESSIIENQRDTIFSSRDTMTDQEFRNYSPSTFTAPGNPGVASYQPKGHYNMEFSIGQPFPTHTIEITDQEDSPRSLSINEDFRSYVNRQKCIRITFFISLLVFFLLLGFYCLNTLLLQKIDITLSNEILMAYEILTIVQFVWFFVNIFILFKITSMNPRFPSTRQLNWTKMLFHFQFAFGIVKVIVFVVYLIVFQKLRGMDVVQWFPQRITSIFIWFPAYPFFVILFIRWANILERRREEFQILVANKPSLWIQI